MENDATERTNLRRFVIRLVGNETLSDDIVQEALLRAHRTDVGFSGRSSRRTWLAAIALNVTRDYYRRASVRLEQAVTDEEKLAEQPSTEDTEHALMEQEMAMCITAHLMALPDRQREVLALHDIEGADHAEVAAVLGAICHSAATPFHACRWRSDLLRPETGQLHCRIKSTDLWISHQPGE
ncbi:MAG: RNA polymerase sigma factor [Alphaproteobacteria bacterium]